MNNINTKTTAVLSPHLLPDEEVLWSGKPARLERWIFICLLMFILLFAVTLIYPVSLALVTGDYSAIASADISYNGVKLDESVTTEELIAILIISIFLLSFTILIFIGFAFYCYRQLYAITSSRVLIKRQSPFFGIASIHFQHISHLKRTGNQKICTITIIDTKDGFTDKVLRLCQVKLSILRNISNPEIVEKILHKQIQQTQRVKS